MQYVLHHYPLCTEISAAFEKDDWMSQLSQIRRSVPPSTFQSLVVRLVRSRRTRSRLKTSSGLRRCTWKLEPLARVADQPDLMIDEHCMRSASSSRLLLPPVRLSTVGSRVFTVAGPRVWNWNTLPEETTSAPSLTIFCQRLKTWLFRQSYLILSSALTSLWLAVLY